MSTLSVLPKVLRALRHRDLNTEVYLVTNGAETGVSVCVVGDHNYTVDINVPSDGVEYLVDPKQAADALAVLAAGGHHQMLQHVSASKHAVDIPPLGDIVARADGAALDALIGALGLHFCKEGEARQFAARVFIDSAEDLSGSHVVSTQGHCMFVHDVHGIAASAPYRIAVYMRIAELLMDLCGSPNAEPLELLIDSANDWLFTMFSSEMDFISVRGFRGASAAESLPTWRGVMPAVCDDTVDMPEMCDALVTIYKQRKVLRKCTVLLFAWLGDALISFAYDDSRELRHVFAPANVAQEIIDLLTVTTDLNVEAHEHLVLATALQVDYVLQAAIPVVSAASASAWHNGARGAVVLDVTPPLNIGVSHTRALIMPRRETGCHVVQGLYGMTLY